MSKVFDLGHVRIEKNIPLKTTYTEGLTSLIRKMKVSDSVLLPGACATNICATGRYVGFKLTQRKQADGKIRVWRVK